MKITKEKIRELIMEEVLTVIAEASYAERDAAQHKIQLAAVENLANVHNMLKQLDGRIADVEARNILTYTEHIRKLVHQLAQGN